MGTIPPPWLTSVPLSQSLLSTKWSDSNKQTQKQKSPMCFWGELAGSWTVIGNVLSSFLKLCPWDNVITFLIPIHIWPFVPYTTDFRKLLELSSLAWKTLNTLQKRTWNTETLAKRIKHTAQVAPCSICHTITHTHTHKHTQNLPQIKEPVVLLRTKYKAMNVWRQCVPDSFECHPLLQVLRI